MRLVIYFDSDKIDEDISEVETLVHNKVEHKEINGSKGYGKTRYFMDGSEITIEQIRQIMDLNILMG